MSVPESFSCRQTIDPQLTNVLSETTLAKPLFAGLFTYDADLKVIPNVATEMPTTENGLPFRRT